MNSFTMTAVGNLARNPELVSKPDRSYTKLCLVGNDYAGKDEEGAAKEVVTSLWFVAFGPMGEAIAHHARKGDQLILEAKVRASNWTDEQGEKQRFHPSSSRWLLNQLVGRQARDEQGNRDTRDDRRPSATARIYEAMAVALPS